MTDRDQQALVNVRGLIDNADFGEFNGLCGAVRSHALREAIDYPVEGYDLSGVVEHREQALAVHVLETRPRDDATAPPGSHDWVCRCGTEFALGVLPAQVAVGSPMLFVQVFPAYSAHLLDAHVLAKAMGEY